MLLPPFIVNYSFFSFQYFCKYAHSMLNVMSPTRVVAAAAPIEPNLGINVKFKTIFSTPDIIDIIKFTLTRFTAAIVLPNNFLIDWIKKLKHSTSNMGSIFIYLEPKITHIITFAAMARPTYTVPFMPK